jgi:hypothetical protein
MRSADVPGLRGFHGGCGSVGLSIRQRHQLSLDLRYLRLRFRNQAFGQAICLQLERELLIPLALAVVGFDLHFRQALDF